jgi:hypothetical protein
VNEKTPGSTGLLSDQSAVRAMHLGGVRLTTLLIDTGLGPPTGETPLGPVNSGELPDTLAALGHDAAAIGTVTLTLV